LEIGMALPVSYQLSEGLSLGGTTTAIAPAGVGDLRLVPKVKLLEVSGLRLAAVAEVSAPTGAADAFLGSGGFSARPRLVADWAPLPALRVLLNGGANLRSPQRLLNLVVGHEVTYGAAVEGALPWAGLQLAAGVAGAVGLSPGSAANHPLELLASARLPLGRHFQLTVGGGAGLGSGYGTPSYRMLAAFSYQSARGVALELPPPPVAVTPVDPDPDHDGIPSSVDECDEKPETRNHYRDEDGCPDTLPGENSGPVVKDQDKDGVPDDQDLCPGLPGEADEDGCPPDDDNDGIVNPLDLCPTRKEVINGFEDEDGCPDKLPRQNTRRRR
ncbi:MAG: cell envelope biogenesis protein OmpA, partial [Myxococcota bacterium]|nr:cell envelope biogenesis protein OmpA [Myxococcota bacterium]